MGSRANQRVKLNADFIFDQPLPSNRKNFIRVGIDYQAELPTCTGGYFVEQNASETDLNTLLWCPSSQTNDTDGQECNHWSDEEIERFCKSLHLNNKNFYKVSKDVQTKSVKQCVQFYYLWKKKCNDQYRTVLPKKNCKDTNIRVLPKKKRVCTQHIISNPHNTRGSAKRAVAAAVKNDLAVERANISCEDEKLSLHDNHRQPPKDSCKIPFLTDGAEAEICGGTSDERVISEKTDTAKQVVYKVKPKTVNQCAQFHNVGKNKFDNKTRSIIPKNRLPIQPIVGNPHNTRGNVKRAVAAAGQKALDLAIEQAQISSADAALQLHDSISKPINGSCKIPYATERVEEAMSCVDINDENVIIRKANTTKVLTFRGVSSTRSLQSQSKPSSHIQIKRKVANQIRTRTAVNGQSRESVFPCGKCERVFAKMKSRNGHMKCHKTA